MDWDPIRPNSAADSAPVAHCRDEAESAAAFEAQLATRYRDGRPIRIDAPLAAFLSPSAASLASSRRRTLGRGITGFVVLFAAVLGLGAANVLPAAAQGAIADAAQMIGLSLPQPAPASDHAPQTPEHAPAHGSHGSSDEPAVHSGKPSPSSRSNAVGSDQPPVTPTHPPADPGQSDPGQSDSGSSAGAGVPGASANPTPGSPESPGNRAEHSQGNGPPMVPGSPGNGPPESPGNRADHSQGNGSKGNGPPSNPGNSSNKQEARP